MRIFSAAGPFAPLFFPPTRPKGVENFWQTNTRSPVFSVRMPRKLPGNHPARDFPMPVLNSRWAAENHRPSHFPFSSSICQKHSWQ
jgi:hypothetical protein